MTTDERRAEPVREPAAAEVFRELAEISREVAVVTEANLGYALFRILNSVRMLAGLRRGVVQLIDYPFNDYYRLIVGGDPPRVQEALDQGADRDLPRRGVPVAPLDDPSPVCAGRQFVTRHLNAGGRKLGELCVSADDDRVWEGGDDEDLLGSLASLAAVALERCARQREAVQLREWLDALSRIFAASLMSEHDSLLQEIADNTRRLTKACFVVLYEYFEEQEDVRLPPTVAGHVSNDKVLCHRSVAAEHKRSAVFRILRQGLPFYAEEAGRDWQAAGLLDGPGGAGSFFAREEVLSSAGLPLCVEKENVGVLFVNYRRQLEFPEDFREHLELFANQAALAIGNARFFQRSKRYAADLLALNRIGRELCSADSRDIGEIGRLVFEKTGEVIPTKNFFVCVCQREGEGFSIPFQRDELDLRESIEEGVEHDLHYGLTGYVCRTSRALLADREMMDRLYADGSAKLVGDPAAIWLGAPLLVRDRVIGALVVQDYSEVTAFNKEHLKLLEAIASQAAIAIDNYLLRQRFRRDE